MTRPEPSDVPRPASFSRSGLWFDVREGGPVAGPPAVLLHGFPQFSCCWDRLAPLLHERGLRTLAPDQRGYSAGARPSAIRAYRLGELVADLIALLDARDLPRVHLVGHDWGAAVVWAAAATHPERVTSVTALSVPPGRAFLRALTSSRQLLRSWYVAAFQLPALPERLLTIRAAAPLAAALIHTGQEPALARRDAAALADPVALGAALNWYRALPLARVGGPAAPMRVPALYVWGDHDPAVGRQAARLAAGAVAGPFRFVRLPGAGHWLPEAEPERVAVLVAEQVGQWE